jgi:hypothetical protein
MPIQNMGTNGRGKSFKNGMAEINYHPFADTGHFGKMEHLLHRKPAPQQSSSKNKEESWGLENMENGKR